MASENICPNCGASNDPVFANCMFCNTPLIKVELSTLSSESIIENCGLWIGRLAGADFEGIHITTGEKGMFKQNHVLLSLGEVKGNVDRYLILLETRVISNPNLEGVLQRLNERYKEALKNCKSNSKNSKVFIVLAIVFIVGIAALCIWAANMGWMPTPGKK